jgi:hypothetical protein
MPFENDIMAQKAQAGRCRDMHRRRRKRRLSLQDKTAQIYDKIIKRILTLSNRAVINLINALFRKNYPPDSEVIYNATESVDDNLGKTISV